MRVLAMLLSVVIAGSFIVGIYNKDSSECKLCNEEHVHETVFVMDASTVEIGNRWSKCF